MPKNAWLTVKLRVTPTDGPACDPSWYEQAVSEFLDGEELEVQDEDKEDSTLIKVTVLSVSATDKAPKD